MFANSTLFPKDNFLQVSHDSFRDAYSNYAEDILSYIKKNIKKEEAINGLRKNYLEYSELNNIATYFIQIECDKDFSNIDNIHNTPKKELSSIIDKLETVLGKEYFKTYATKIKKAIELLKSIFDEIDKN